MMPMGATILLNLTGKLSFEAADPLLSVVDLLFYDRLSVQKPPSPSLFPPEGRMPGEKHIRRLASTLSNLLEARALSEDDDGGRIRIIVTLDMEEESQKCFPAQKARMIRLSIADVFGQNNPLLARFDYSFIFLAESAGHHKRDDFYCLLARDGYTGVGADEWIGSFGNLDSLRDEVFSRISNAEDEWQVTDKRVCEDFAKFCEELEKEVNRIASRMDEAGLCDAFKALFRDRTQYVTTVGDFIRCDYDGILHDCVSQLIGFVADDFKRDCTFFVVATDSSTITTKRSYETFVSSLVQLLATMRKEDYKTLLQNVDINAPARIFTIGTPENIYFDKDAFTCLMKMVADDSHLIRTSRWEKSQNVTYRVFVPKADDPRSIDSYRQLNDKYAEERQAIYCEWEKVKKIPFFFGRQVGDWNWYKRVVGAAEEIFLFESINDRPLYDPPQRITDDRISIKEEENTYAGLEEVITIMTKEAPQLTKVKDIDEYMKERHGLMDKMREGIDGLKREMVKLGYLSCLIWIGFFSCIAFTVDFCYHMLWYDNEESLWLVAECLGVIGLLFVVSAIVARGAVKKKICAQYAIIDGAYRQMQENLRNYLNDINRRVKQQNEADVRRKNLDEINAKLDEFNSHNCQVDIWTAHYCAIAEKLSKTIKLLSLNPQPTFHYKKSRRPDDQQAVEDIRMSFPTLSEEVRQAFADRTVKFTNKGIEVSGVTSFVTHFKFSEN